jgi:hypothetical protein
MPPMKRVLTWRSADRAAWTALALLTGAVLVALASLGIERVLATRPPPGAGTISQPDVRTGPLTTAAGTIEQVEGGALVLRIADGALLRVLLRGRAEITSVGIAGDADALRPGDTIAVGPLVEMQDNTLGVTTIALTPPGTMLEGGCGRFGTVISVSATRLVYEGGCGEQFVPIVPNVRVSRFQRAGPEALRVGRHATVSAERLPDGTLAAFAIQVTGP